MDPFPENQKSAEEEIIKEQFEIWNNLAEKNSNTNLTLDIDDKEWQFAIDRRKENDSKFTADEVAAYRLKDTDTLENYLGTEKTDLKTHEGENWTVVTVTPQDPYRSKIAAYEDNGNTFYYTETLSIYISSTGRAFEETQWAATLKPDIHKKQNPRYSYLKEYPKEQDVIKLNEEPENEIIEPFQPLTGQGITRLQVLHREIQKGNIL